MTQAQSDAHIPAGDLKLLYIGAGAHVCAIDALTGVELWRTKIKNNSTLISLLVRDGMVFAGAGGRVYALDAFSGQLLWQNDLKGLGWGTVLMAMEGQAIMDAAAAAAVVAQQRAAAASAG